MPHVHNALHHFTALQDAFRKAVGEIDPGFTGIERAGETLTPIVNLWERPERSALRGELLWALFHNQAAVAAELTFVGLRNPAGSGFIAVVEKIMVQPAAAMSMHVFRGATSATDVDGAEQLVTRDTRFPLVGAGPLFKIHGTGGAAIGSDGYFERYVDPAITPNAELWGPYVITPGFDLRVYGLSANVGLSVNMQGYAYRALPGELVV